MQLQQTVPEFHGSQKDLLLLLPLEGHQDLISEGRKVLDPAQADLQLIKAVVILLGRQLNDGVVGGQGLDQGPALAVSPAGPAHHLGKHIEGGLRRPEGAGIEAQVRVQCPNQGYIRQVQALGHHLGAQKDLFLSPAEPVQNDLVGIGGADGIRVHSGHGHVRKQFIQFLLGLLGAYAKGFQGAATLGAPLRHRLGEAAVVAHKPVVGAVVGESRAAPGTLRGLPAVHADQGPGVSPAVQQQNGLLSGGAGIVDGLAQRDTQAVAVAQLQLLPHIHHFHIGKSSAIESGFQPIEVIFPLPGPVHALHRRGGRAQKNQGLFFEPPPDSHLLGGITGSIFRFVRVLLLLIQNHQAQTGAGGEDGGPGANHQVGLSLLDPPPLIVPLPRGEAGMKHRHLVPKPGGHQSQKLGRQGNFRHQQHRRLAPAQGLFDGFDIDGGLAGTGDSIEKGYPRGLTAHLGFQPLEYRRLLLAQDQGLLDGSGDDLPAPQDLSLGKGQEAPLFQPGHRIHGGSGVIADVLDTGRPHGAQQLQNASLHGGTLGPGGGKGHGLLGGYRQKGNALQFVSALPGEFLLCLDPLFPDKVAKDLSALVLLRDHSAKRRLPAPAALIPKIDQDLLCPLLADGGSFPAPVLGKAHGLLLPKPVSRRKDGPDGIVEGAEVPLPEKGRQPKLGVAQQRLRFQDPFYIFQSLPVPFLQGKDQSLGAGISKAEGHGDPLAQAQGKALGHPVGIGLVHGIDCVCNGDACDHSRSSLGSKIQCLYSSFTVALSSPSATSWMAMVTGFSGRSSWNSSASAAI